MKAMTVQRWRHSGFTLIELLVVIALVAILAMLAAPSFRVQMANSRVSSTGQELQTLLQFARSEAVYKRSEVEVTESDSTWSVKLGAQVLRTATVPATVKVDPDGDSKDGLKFDNTGVARLVSAGEPPYKLTISTDGATRVQCVSVTRMGLVRQERVAAGSSCP